MRNVKEKVKWRTSGQVLMCKKRVVAGYLLIKQIHLKIDPTTVTNWAMDYG